MPNQARKQTGKQFPLDNLTYDLISLIHEKSESLQVYDIYLEDAAGDEEIRGLFEQLRAQDEEFIVQLKEHLSRRLNESTGQASGQGAARQRAAGQGSGGGGATKSAAGGSRRSGS